MPQTIGVEQSLLEANQLMRRLGARHLPVMSESELVGLLSERDLELAAGLGTELSAVSVALAMTEEIYVVAPDELLVSVVSTMSERKFACALVVSAGLVVGILTTTDALKLLVHALEKEGPFEQKELLPSEVRRRLRQEHELLRAMAERVKSEAQVVLAGATADDARLRNEADELYAALLRHLDLEDEILTPALREVPVSGPIRAGILLNKHAEQRRAIHGAQSRLTKSDPTQLATSLVRLSEILERELRSEEKFAHNSRILRDDLVQEGVTGG